MKSGQNLKQGFIHELKVYVSYVLFLTLFFSTFSFYRRLILQQYDLGYLYYGYNLAESFILAKIILIGQHLRLGERFLDKPLIIPVIYKTLVFCLFVIVFNLLEHIVIGFFLGHSFSSILQEVYNQGIDEILAKLYINVVVFFLFFAFLELGRFIGEDRLFDLFFRRRNTQSHEKK